MILELDFEQYLGFGLTTQELQYMPRIRSEEIWGKENESVLLESVKETGLTGLDSEEKDDTS